jgi:hypothetical protein
MIAKGFGGFEEGILLPTSLGASYVPSIQS